MHVFSRIVFAFVDFLLGLFVGTVAAVILALVLLRGSAGGPGDGIGLIFLAMLGAGCGAILGLIAGVVLPGTYGRKQNSPKDARTPVDEHT